MNLPKHKSAATSREAKRRLENPLTKAQKDEKLRMMPRDYYVKFSERQIEIVRDLELRLRDEALEGMKG